MPFSDEFSYDKTALEFARTGHILYNGWATAMLGWLIPWGALFIKVFGFSFTGMRLSMLPIDAATVYLFHQILCHSASIPATRSSERSPSHYRQSSCPRLSAS